MTKSDNSKTLLTSLAMLTRWLSVCATVHGVVSGLHSTTVRMKVRWCNLLILIFFSAFLMPVKITAQKASHVVDIANRQVSFELVKREDFEPVKWPDEHITLIIVDVTIKDGETIPKLLEAGGIVPDNEAYTLVYDLNPELNDLTEAAPNNHYRLPKVVGGELIEKRLNEDCMVLLTVDPELKTQLRNRSKTLTVFARKFNKLRRTRFTNPKRIRSTKRNVRDLAGWYENIHKTVSRRTAQPMRRVTLVQIVNEAEALMRLLSGSIRSKRQVDSTVTGQIFRIHQDVEAFVARQGEKMGGDLPGPDAQYDLEVVIKASDGAALANLRVYYVINGYYRDPPTNPPVKSSGFDRLGSRVSQPLPVHYYRVWVAKDGEPGNPIIKARKVYVNRKMTIELSLQ